MNKQYITLLLISAVFLSVCLNVQAHTTNNTIAQNATNSTNTTTTSSMTSVSTTTILPVPLNVTVSPSNATIDVGQTLTLDAEVQGGSGNFTYQWYNDTNGTGIGIAGTNSSAYSVTAIANATGLRYYVLVTDNSTPGVNATSNAATINVDPSLNISVDFYPVVLNLTSGHSFTFNALYSTQVSGGTGDYVYTWDTADLPSSAFVVNASCYTNTPFCEVTAANVNESISGTLTVSISDTSDGNSSYANPQYYFATANPDPPLPADYLGRNISSLFQGNQRIGIVVPSIGQIVYALGLGNEVVAMTDASHSTLPSFGIDISKNVVDIGLNNDYYLPDYATELVNTTVNYVPIDAGAFEGTLAEGLADFQAKGINTVVLGGGFDSNISDVEDDVMLVANTTETTAQGEAIVAGMKSIVDNVQGKVAGMSKPKVAMIIWYGYGSMFVDGNESFIGSEMSTADAHNIFSGFYPSPSPVQIISSNPDYIIASIFGTPFNNISTTYQSLSTIPGIQNTSAWKNGRVYILGNLATNITNEPGPLAAYGILLYAIILHPQQFGFTQATLPNNITDEWVLQNVMPSLVFAPTEAPNAAPATTASTTISSTSTTSSTSITTTTILQAANAVTTTILPTTTSVLTAVAPATTVEATQQNAVAPEINNAEIVTISVVVAVVVIAALLYNRISTKKGLRTEKGKR